MEREVPSGEDTERHTSLSTEETGSEEFNDNHSVISDSAYNSLLSLSGGSNYDRTIKKSDAKKLISHLQRVKQENARLKELLESSNTADVSILRTKLRGAQADIVRLKQNNSELKDRIQELDDRIFRLLSDRNNLNSEPDTAEVNEQSESAVNSRIDDDNIRNNNNIREILRKKKRESLQQNSLISTEETKDDNDGIYQKLMKQENALIGQPPEYMVLYSRCKHYEKLIQSYERRLKAMEVSINLIYVSRIILLTFSYFLPGGKFQ